MGKPNTSEIRTITRSDGGSVWTGLSVQYKKQRNIEGVCHIMSVINFSVLWQKENKKNAFTKLNYFCSQNPQETQ